MSFSSYVETSTDASRILFMDSRDGTNTNNDPQITTQYYLNLQDAIVVPHHHAILLSLHRLNIPRTFYNFEKNRNNGVDVVFESAGGGTGAGFGNSYIGGLPQLTFEINEGNYNAISLMNKLTTIINNYLETGESRYGSGNLVAGDVDKYEFKMLFNADTLKYEWLIEPKLEADKQDPNNDIRMSFLWKSSDYFGTDLPTTDANRDTSIRQEAGFISNKFMNGTTQDFFIEFVGDALSSDADPSLWSWNAGYGTYGDGAGWGTYIRTANGFEPINITDDLQYFRGYDDGATNRETGDNNYLSCVDVNYHTTNLYLHTSLSQDSVIDSRIGCRYSNILSRIPVSVGNGEQIIVEPSDGSVHKLFLKIREITQVQIKLTDLDGKVIDLQGLDWTMSLEFDFIQLPKIEIPKDKRLTIEEERYKKFMESTEGKEAVKQLKEEKKIETKINLPNV